MLALLRALPKSVRRTVMPLAGLGQEFVAGAGAGNGSLHEALARFLDRTRAVSVPRDAWSPARLRRVLPAHLLMRFEVTDENWRNGRGRGRARCPCARNAGMPRGRSVPCPSRSRTRPETGPVSSFRPFATSARAWWSSTSRPAAPPSATTAAGSCGCSRLA